MITNGEAKRMPQNIGSDCFSCVNEFSSPIFLDVVAVAGSAAVADLVAVVFDVDFVVAVLILLLL